MRRLALSLAACLLAAPAGAQQYWLPNGSGGTTFNNPQGSLLGTANERMLQRHMQQRQMGGGGPAQATPSPSMNTTRMSLTHSPMGRRTTRRPPGWSTSMPSRSGPQAPSVAAET